MIAKGKSISHGTAALEYDLAKEINGEAAATEIHRHELFGCTGEEMVQEMKPYFVDFPNVRNNCLRFEVSPSVEESAGMTDADWAKLGNDFMQRMVEEERSESPIEITDDGLICKSSKVILTIELPETYVGSESYLYLEGVRYYPESSIKYKEYLLGENPTKYKENTFTWSRMVRYPLRIFQRESLGKRHCFVRLERTPASSTT